MLMMRIMLLASRIMHQASIMHHDASCAGGGMMHGAPWSMAGEQLLIAKGMVRSQELTTANEETARIRQSTCNLLPI
jgi:hypothetical protein